MLTLSLSLACQWIDGWMDELKFAVCIVSITADCFRYIHPLHECTYIYTYISVANELETPLFSMEKPPQHCREEEK